MRAIVAVATAALLLAGCAESDSTATATVNTSDTVLPTSAFMQAAKQALTRLPAENARWSRGIVIGETADDKDWALRVLTERGVLVLTEPVGCTEWHMEERQWHLIADPGDAVRWKWRDDGVCEGDLRVTEVGAVR